MNQRIQDLAKQAGYYLYDLTETHECKTVETDSKDEWITLEKFAELIVRDIFNIMNDQKTYNRCTYTTHDLDKAKCVVEEVIKCVNEHFGTKL
jgi:hypothetical protein